MKRRLCMTARNNVKSSVRYEEMKISRLGVKARRELPCLPLKLRMICLPLAEITSPASKLQPQIVLPVSVQSQERETGATPIDCSSDILPFPKHAICNYFPLMFLRRRPKCAPIMNIALSSYVGDAPVSTPVTAISFQRLPLVFGAWLEIVRETSATMILNKHR